MPRPGLLHRGPGALTCGARWRSPRTACASHLTRTRSPVTLFPARVPASDPPVETEPSRFRSPEACHEGGRSTVAAVVARLSDRAAFTCLHPHECGYYGRPRDPAARGTALRLERTKLLTASDSVVPEGRILAVTRATRSSNHHASFPGAPLRVSFAKLDQPLEVPDLLHLQTQSFEWLVGSEEGFERRVEAGEDLPVGGLEEVLSEISPIEDFSGSMSLSFSDPRFDEVKASVEEGRGKGLAYLSPPFVPGGSTKNNTPD